MSLFVAPMDVDLTISKVLTDEKTKRHLTNLGLCVGSCVRVLSHTTGDLIIKIMDTSLALNKDTALKIIVA